MPCAKVFTVDFQHLIPDLVCMACETQNLLTSQYILSSEIPSSRNLYHTETTRLQCSASQLNSFKRHSKFNSIRAGLF